MSIKVTRTPKSIIVWHSVNDELPDADIEVMLGTSSGDVVLGYWDDQDNAWIAAAIGSECFVVYWAELPEVPK